MKRLISLAVLAGVLVGGVVLGEESPIKGEKPKYQVIIKVVYNSVEKGKVADITELILSRHEGACKVDVDISRAEDSEGYVISSGSLEFDTALTIESQAIDGASK